MKKAASIYDGVMSLQWLPTSSALSANTPIGKQRLEPAPPVVRPPVYAQLPSKHVPGRPSVDSETPVPSPTFSTPTLGDAFQTRGNNLIAMRLVLALTVVFSHSYPLSFGAGHGDWLYRTTAAWWSMTTTTSDHAGTAVSLVGGSTGVGITTGFIAVCVFFVLSGFVITHSFLRSGSVTDFLRKRAGRIYPAYLLAAAVCFFIFAPIAMGALSASLISQLPRFVSDTLFLRQFQVDGLFTNNPFPHALNGSIWSIKYEVVCYVLIVSLGTAGVLRRPRLVLSLFAAVASLYALQITGALEAMHLKLWWPRKVAWLLGEIDHWPRVLTYHLAGMSLYLYRNSLPRQGSLAIVALATTLVTAALSATALMVLMPLSVGYIALYLALSTRGRSVTGRLDKLDLSYGVYLYAFPIQQLLIQSVPQTLGNPLLLFALSAPAALGLAVISRRLIESRFARR